MNKNLKKVISAASALAVSASGIAAFAANYPDVPSTANYYQAINELSALGVISGFEDGTFRPDENVTRAQITKMVVTALGTQVAAAAEASAGRDTQFTDVPGSHWAAGFVSVGTSSAAQNFINGYSATSFGPEDNVTYAQAIKMLVAALGYSSSAEGAGGWPSGYLKYGYSLGLTTGLSGIGNDQQLNRSQVAVLIDNALKCPICVTTGQMTYNQFGQPIPITIPKDGTGDLDGTKDGYQNLLNYAHDAYLVYGRVWETFKSSGGTIEADQIRFNVEKADNWEGYSKFAGKYGDEADLVRVYKGQVTDADEYLFTYAEAIIAKDINDEYTLVSLTPYGSTENKELETGDYKQIKLGSNGQYQLQMYKDSGRSKYDTYKIEANAGLYVNGKEITSDIASSITDFFDGDYVKGNKVGKITLVDKTDEAKSTTDGIYDYAMVSYYVDAVVDYVDVDTDEIVIVLDTYDENINEGEIVLDLEDEDKDYHVVLDGAEIDASELQKGDVISVAYDITEKRFKDSNSYDIIVSRNQIEGRVTSVYEEKGAPLDNEYTLDDGNVYKVAYDKAAKPENGNSYTFYLDAFGKIAKAEDLASSKKYAILENVYMTNGNSDAYVDIITADGYKQSYQIKIEDYKEFIDALMEDPSEFDGSDKLNNRKQPEDRVIVYTTTAKGELRLKEVAKYDDFDGDYKASTGKIGGKQLTEALSAVIDLSDYKMNKSQAYSKIAVSELNSGTTYSGYAFGKIGTDRVYQFVIIKSGIGGWNVENSWAVFVNKTNIDTDTNGNTDAIKAYVGGELITLASESSLTVPATKDTKEYKVSIDSLTPGDVFFYNKNSEGEVSEIMPVASGLGASYRDYYRDAVDSKFDIVNDTTAKEFANDNGLFNKNNNIKDCELISGALVDVASDEIKLASVSEFAETNKYTQDIERFEIDNAKSYELASDVNVVVYDYSVNKAKDRVYATRGASGIRKTAFDRTAYVTDDRRDNIVSFEKEYKAMLGADNSNYGKVNFAIVKVVDDEVTEILVIIPDNDDGN